MNFLFKDVLSLQLKLFIIIIGILIFCFIVTFLNDQTILTLAETIQDHNNQLLADVIKVGKNPIALSYNNNTHKLYVLNEGDSTLDVINGFTNKVTNKINLPYKPITITINTLKNLIYVGYSNSKIISIIDGTNDIIETNITIKVKSSSIERYKNVSIMLTLFET